MRILAIESSCDETAAAIIENGTTVLSSVISSSSSLHQQFGGILPELAARKQLDFILPVLIEALKPLGDFQQWNNEAIEQSLKKIDAIAVTVGPGLIGSLLVGVEAAKTIAFVSKKPLIPINHVHAHIYANFIHDREINFPAIALVVSGGHTELFFMENKQSLQWLSGTVDDAAGEAFDKTARLLGFENKGGQAIEDAAKKFQILKSKFQIRLPRPLLHDDTLNFSFSGLKTAVLREWNKYSSTESHIVDKESLISAFAYEIQEAITDVLVKKTLKAAELHNVGSILLAGGVAANQRLREKFQQLTNNNLQVYFPPKDLCTDNAVAIGSAAFFLQKVIDWHQVTAAPGLSVEI